MRILHKSQTETATIILVFFFSAMLIYSISGIHIFGDVDGSHVAQQYLHNGSDLTGSTNIVNSIVWDFRGFDTMGEEIVFFTGAIGVALVARNIKKTRKAGSGRKK